ncbi:MAG: DUF547 domain-containing protein [Phycisphaeraceae bacterium]
MTHSSSYTGATAMIDVAATPPFLARLAPYAGWIRWLAIALLVLAVFVFMGALPIGEAIRAFEGVIRGMGAWGLIVFALVYAVAAVALIPGSALTIAAGAIFGPLWGGWGLLWATLAVSLGSNLGAALALLIGRYLARDKVSQWAKRNPKFGAVDRAIATGGWKIVALLRLSPAIPFNLQNYLYGLTPIRFWTAVLTSIVAMLPGTFLFVYIGYLGRVGAETAAGTNEPASIGKWVMLALGLVATVAVTVYITRLAQRMLREQTQIEPMDEEPSASDESDRPGPPNRSPRGALILLLVSVVALAGACTARAGGVLDGLFGPPSATLTEAYEHKADGPAFDHSLLDEVLADHVSDEGGWVDYAALARDTGALDRYLVQLADAPFDEMGRDQKLALMINAYNAFTLKLITEHAPRIDSIKDIPSAERWDDQRWDVGGHVWSLNQIEHEQIRPKFREPRIHWALVCAAVGCPPLRNEAYTAARLEQQLANQAAYVHNHERWFRYHGGETVHLTELYNWYGGDFEQVAGSVLQYAARYSDELKRALERGERPRIEWIDYDWTLNSMANRPEQES